MLLTLLGLWVSASDRVFDLAGRTAFILLWVGFMALFRGVSDIVLAFTMLSYAKPDDHIDDRVSVAERPAPSDGSRRLTDTPSTSRG